MVLYKTLIPYGDEPDFLKRVTRLSYNPIFDFMDFKSIKSVFLCLDKYSPHSFFYSLSDLCIKENFSVSYFLRILFPMVNLILLFLFATLFAYILNIRISPEDKKVIALTFLFPFVIYILSFTSTEIYIHYFTLLLFLENFLIRFLILGVLFLLEYDGQFLVCLLFVLFSVFNMTFSSLKSPNQILINVSISLLIIFIYKNLSSISLIIPDIYVNKIGELLNLGDQTNYNYLERLLIVFFTMSFMTANGIKLVLGNIYFMYKHFGSQLLKMQKSCKVEILSALSTIFILIAILPKHSYAKYYLFLIPVILKGLLSIIDFDKLRNSLIISNLINFIYLSYLIYA